MRWQRANMSWERASVVLYCSVLPSLLLLNLFWLWCWSHGFIWLMAVYAIWYAWSYRWPFDGSLRGWPWLRSFMKPVFDCFRGYFPAQVQFHDLNQLRERIDTCTCVMFACHPHGILATSTILQMSMDPSPWLACLPPIELHCLTLDLNLRVPFWREWLMAFALGGINRRSCLAWLKPRVGQRKPAIALVPGGAREALYAVPNTLRLVLEKRFGFLRLARETAALIVPVLCLGENDLWPQQETKGWPRALQELILKHPGIAVPLLQSWLPHSRPLNTWIGEGIIVDPEEDIASLHARYKQALIDMHAAAQLRLGRKLPPPEFI